MRVSISAGGQTPDLPFFVVDGHGFLIDLSKIAGELWDPTVASIDWSPVVVHGTPSEAGYVRLRNGTGRSFSDRALLTPYLKAWKAKKAELLDEPTGG